MAQSDLHRDQSTDLPTGYERSDLKPGTIALFGIGLAVVIGAAVVITSLFVHYRALQHSRQETPVPRLAGEREATPEPRLQVDAPKELRQMRAAEEAALNSYGWVDKDAGIVKIPVDRAMEILAKKGLPARKQEQKTR
jgi:hypothetical protein